MDEPLPPDCAEVAERLADVIDGSAGDRLYAHIADCDRCRDARHEAELALAAARAAGADYRAPAELEQRLAQALDRDAERSESKLAGPSADADARKLPPKAAPQPRAWSWPNPQRLRWGAAALLVAAAGVLALRGGGDESADMAGGGAPWRGTLERVVSAHGGEGVKVCAPDGGACRKLDAGAELPAASVVKTDERTRARVRLSDGTIVTLERATELELVGSAARRARLTRGSLTADVARSTVEARIDLPRGLLTVHGTKFALRVDGPSASVDVARGSVTLADTERRSVRVNAGESARLVDGSPPFVSFSESFGEALAWSDETFGDAEPSNGPRGLGELKAKKPGQDGELAGAVTLARHTVRVRIAGLVARTEIEEVFENHTDDVLEGIYRFPMPPDAQIERLALDVDGKLEEGAFLDRERAASIWRGAIVHAAPKAKRPLDEIVWVPGPWKDPALLEWQRGGRFELRIFPIPKRGSRRVVLAYTEVVKPSGDTRRYTYPLAYDPGGSVRVGRFELDVQVRGHDERSGVRPIGYTLERKQSNGATSLGFSAQSFVPSGDLVLEYALPNAGAEVTTFAYQAKEAPTGATPGSASTPGGEADDGSPYVALALRPKLPRAERETERALALVVDASRSMLGESYRRASELATRLARELDARDRITLLACDVECRALPDGALTPGVAAAGAVKRFLASITPDGGSDLVGAVRRALRELERGEAHDSRAYRVVYLGDGAPTVGEVRPGTVERAIARSVDRARASVTAVAVGAESDAPTLAAVARGGGGVVLPYTPGRSVAETAYAVLAATYGQVLSDVEVVLPGGFHAAAPRRLDAIPAGGEGVLVARMDGSARAGEVVLRGRVGGKPFERTYAIDVRASDTPGNAFVPRLHAAARIADLEREGTADAKRTAIALSSRFNVASRYTSLLVLESPAMFKAFGLDNTRRAPTWSGEEAAEGEIVEEPADAPLDAFDEIGDDLGSGGLSLGSASEGRGSAIGGSAPPRARLERRAPAPAKKLDAEAAPLPTSAPRPASPAPKPAAERQSSVIVPDSLPLPDPRRRMIPMRRTFERSGQIFTDRLVPRAAGDDALLAAERRLEADENRRESVKQLFALLVRAGRIDRAQRISERWSEKEPLDPEAITARADVLAANGERQRAIRVLSGVADVRPGDIASQKRLARLHRWAGEPELSCRYAVAMAELRSADSALLADAVRCARGTGDASLADELLVNADAATRKAAEALLARPAPDDGVLRGDLKVEGRWSGGVDLDLALVHPDGHRVSWLGAPTRSIITARDVTSTSGEGLALNNPQAGEYVIEVVRPSGAGRASGELVVTAGKTTRRIPFTLDGSRTTVALASITLRQVLVPIR